MLERLVSTLMQRAYRQQLNAPRVHLWRVMLCSGDWDSYRHLRALYAFIDKGAQDPDFWENNRAMFWGKYWQVEQGHQPWLVAHLHRSIGLREGDPFYQNPVNNRTWLYSDMKDRHIPCQMIWSWLQAAANERLESACLLSSYTHTELHEELTRRAKAGYDDQDMGYFFVSMTVAMVYRMTLESLAQEFEQESHSWKAMFARWDLDSRLFLLRVFGSFERGQSQKYLYEWGPDLFPEAQGMLDVARATGVQPAHLLRQWYDQRGAAPEEMLDLKGLV